MSRVKSMKGKLKHPVTQDFFVDITTTPEVRILRDILVPCPEMRILREIFIPPPVPTPPKPYHNSRQHLTSCPVRYPEASVHPRVSIPVFANERIPPDLVLLERV